MTTLQLVADGWRRRFGRIDRAWLAVASEAGDETRLNRRTVDRTK